MMSLARFGLVVCAHLMGLTLYAQEQPANEALGNAAANAVNPMAFITKLQVQPNFTWKEDMARQLNLTTRLVQPTESIGLPFIKSKNPSKVYMIYRFEIPIIGQNFTETPALDATGISNIKLS